MSNNDTTAEEREEDFEFIVVDPADTLYWVTWHYSPGGEEMHCSQPMTWQQVEDELLADEPGRRTTYVEVTP